jgi:hypothetical protein
MLILTVILLGVLSTIVVIRLSIYLLFRLQRYTNPHKAENNSPNKNNYWNQLLKIIGDYCFSKPQQEAQEPRQELLMGAYSENPVK